MAKNKRNTTMETEAVLFLVSRSDVSQPICCTYDSNEHVYGMWRQILREFNMKDLVQIVCVCVCVSVHQPVECV